MQVPKYIKDILSRSHFECGQPFCSPGYTLAVGKATKWKQAASLAQDIDSLCAWASREFARRGFPTDAIKENVVIHDVPHETHHCQQWAFITIFDPLMMEIEDYIGKKE